MGRKAFKTRRSVRARPIGQRGLKPPFSISWKNSRVARRAAAPTTKAKTHPPIQVIRIMLGTSKAATSTRLRNWDCSNLAMKEGLSSFFDEPKPSLTAAKVQEGFVKLFLVKIGPINRG